MPASPATQRTRWIGAASALAVLAIWTAFILISRSSAHGSLKPFDIAFLRYTVSGLIALPVAALRGAALRRGLGGEHALKRGAALALTAGIGYCGFAYSGFFFAPAAHASVLLPGSLPLWTAVFAALLLGERVAGLRAAGLALIVAGDVLVGGASLLHGGGSAWKGDLLFLGGANCWALYGVLCRLWRVGALDATLAIALGCLLAFVPAYALLVGAGWVASGLAQAPWHEILLQGLFQGGLSMFVSGIAFTQVLATWGPQRATLLTAIVPALAALAAVPLLDEALTAATCAGLACVSGGLLLGLWGGRLPRPAAVRVEPVA